MKYTVEVQFYISGGRDRLINGNEENGLQYEN